MSFVLLFENHSIRRHVSFIQYSDWIILEHEFETHTGIFYDDETWSVQKHNFYIIFPKFFIPNGSLVSEKILKTFPQIMDLS